jgi:pyrophosphatase PpaX
VRYETVLFDLDGTLIDSGGMILASFKHATREVLGVDVPDEQILAAVGGPGLLDQMRALDGDRVDFAVLPLEQYFDVVVAYDDTERHKPHPDPILKAVELAETVAANCVYVGDSPFDVRAAKAAGVAAVAVTWGKIHSADVLRAEAPDAIVDTRQELYGVL